MKSIYVFLCSKKHCELLNATKAIFEIRRLNDILFRYCDHNFWG